MSRIISPNIELVASSYVPDDMAYIIDSNDYRQDTFWTRDVSSDTYTVRRFNTATNMVEAMEMVAARVHDYSNGRPDQYVVSYDVWNRIQKEYFNKELPPVIIDEPFYR